MPPRYTEHYRVYEDDHGQLLVSYEDDWEVIEKVILDIGAAFVIARRRSPDWVIQVFDGHGNELRRFTPNSYLFSVPRDNPGGGQFVQVYDGSGYVKKIMTTVFGDWDPGSSLSRREFFPIVRYRGSWYPLHKDPPAFYINLHEALPDVRARKILDWSLERRKGVRELQRTRREAMDNPDGYPQPAEGEVEHYEHFHGTEPSEVLDMEVWVPGGMVLVGVGKDVGYGILNEASKKDGWYVHDFGDQVKVYRRARQGERADKTWSSFPHQLTVLGYNLGFTFLDGGVGGSMQEVKGSEGKYLGVTPNKLTLVVVGPKGVEYLMEGGNMRVDDWIRD